MPLVFVGTNVLFPFSVMDLLLVLTEDAVHEVIWADALLDEWRRSPSAITAAGAPSAASVTARHACGNVLWYSTRLFLIVTE